MTVETAKNADTTKSPATSAESRIHWAAAPTGTNPELEARFEAMRARNWITDRMVEQYQKHWHCSREQALERLLPKAGE
ncbi:MAG TPA: hypothetical protein VH253_20700 [Phycisphaerae bacterium]|nr:hypothetical protein [Phycisphaerae bacterium]